MPFDFDEIIDRKGTQSIKYEAGKTRTPHLSENALPLWIADMDFATPAPILDAMRARLDRRILGYSSIDDRAYLDSVAGWMQRRFDWTIDPKHIVFSAGIVSTLYAAVDILTKPNDGVLMMTPAYHPFDQAVRDLGRKPIYNRLINCDGYFTIDFADLERKLSAPSCRMLFWCSPQNPTGRVWTQEELRRVGELCFSNDVFVVSDEIHFDLVRAGVRHTPLAKLFPDQKRIVTCTSPSKTFNIAGNRHANIIIPDEAVREQWRHSAYCGHPGPLSIAATMAAYNECADWLEALQAYLDDSFAMMADAIQTTMPKAKFRIPEGTYLGWVDLTAYGYSEKELNRRISENGVFVQFGEDFLADGEGFMRINIACPRSILSEALRRIAEALE